MIEYPIANPEIVFREEDGEALLFDPKTGEIKLLNKTGSLIYKLCDGRHKREDMVKEIIENFEIEDEKRVRSDLDKFLKELQDKGFIGKEIGKRNEKRAL